MSRSPWQSLALIAALVGALLGPAQHEVVALSDEHEHSLSIEGTPTRVEALRVGARRGEATGMLAKLVEHRAESGVTWHLEISLPGVLSVVHLVEEHTSAGSRLIHRETTGARGRTLRLVSTSDGRRDLVTYGEGQTLRRDPDLPTDTVLPLERLDLERRGLVEPGPFVIFDPLIGRAETMLAERLELAWTAHRSAPRVPVIVWQHLDDRGDVRRQAWFVGPVLVAFSPAPGRALATVVDATTFDELRIDTKKGERESGPEDWR